MNKITTVSMIDDIAEFFNIEPLDVKLLKSDVDWDAVSDEMDKECIPLCDALNAINGIITFESCSGHGKEELSVFFKSTSWKGLFFVTRCIDNRYWEYGDKWTCELIVGDTYRNGILPIHFWLHSEDVGDDAYEQANDLVGNLNFHLNHPAFKSKFELEWEGFNLL